MAPLGHARRAFMTSADPCHTGNWSGAQQAWSGRAWRRCPIDI